jgi:leader peptidase (prepilin peptidase)/N-methyltransferase
MQLILDPAAWQTFFGAIPGLFPAIAAFFGAVLASFSGVLADRLPLMLGLRSGVAGHSASLTAPSRCGACQTRLSAVALIPVLGWLRYRGRCFACAAPVSWVYPAVEALAALLSAAFAIRFGATEAGICSLVLLWGCIAISWIDWREHVVPESLSLPLLLLGLVISPFEPTALARNEGLVFGWVMVWGVSALVGASKRVDAVSGGDVVLAGLAGAWLGLRLMPAFMLINMAVFVAYAVPLQFRRKRSARLAAPDAAANDPLQEIPYSGPMGPALCTALMICIWFGGRLAVPLP